MFCFVFHIMFPLFRRKCPSINLIWILINWFKLDKICLFKKIILQAILVLNCTSPSTAKCYLGLAQALGKARPHSRPRLRGTGHQLGLRPFPPLPFLKVQSTNFLLESTVLSSYFLLDSTVPASNHYLIGHLILLGGRRGGDVLLNILFRLCLYTKNSSLGCFNCN